MTGQTIILRGPAQCAQAKRLIDVAERGSEVLIIPPGEKRTGQQNRTLHMWFGEIAKHLGDRDATQIKGECHRKWGLTIRLRDPKFAWVWKHSGEKLSYEKQCKLLASGVLNVSSGMSVAELSEYMDAILRDYREGGIYLTDPELQGCET